LILLILADDASIKTRFRSYFGKLGYSVIQYSHPLKIMDNIDEISPDVLVCSAVDYPRHWKLVVKQLRESKDRTETAVILIVDKDFDPEEADKAAFLGVNFLFPGRLETLDDFKELDRKISRYKTPLTRFRGSSWIPGDDDRVTFIFRHPDDFRMICGKFTELSAAGGVFRADDPSDVAGLTPGTLIDGGSLRAGDSLISLRGRIIRNSGSLSLAFIDFADNGFQNLLDEMSLHVAIV